MVSKRHRQRNNELPHNIWNGTGKHILQSDESICEDCKGCGGYRETGNEHDLIQMCPTCNGRGYHDWIDKAKGKPLNDCLQYISVRKEEMGDESEKRIILRIEQFKFIDKDEL